MGENHFAAAPTAVYGFVLLMAAVAYTLLQRAIVAREGRDSVLGRVTTNNDFKGRISPVLYTAAIPLAFVRPWMAGALYVAVALMWLVPDTRIERALIEAHREKAGPAPHPADTPAHPAAGA
jgi:uncharacterized membrane protein